jgi:hypothetical protein
MEMPFAAAHGSGYGTKRTRLSGLTMSVVEGRTEMPFQRGHFRFLNPTRILAAQVWLTELDFAVG